MQMSIPSALSDVCEDWVCNKKASHSTADLMGHYFLGCWQSACCLAYSNWTAWL